MELENRWCEKCLAKHHMKYLILTKLWLEKKQNFYTSVQYVERENVCLTLEAWQNLRIRRINCAIPC